MGAKFQFKESDEVRQLMNDWVKGGTQNISYASQQSFSMWFQVLFESWLTLFQ